MSRRCFKVLLPLFIEVVYCTVRCLSLYFPLHLKQQQQCTIGKIREKSYLQWRGYVQIRTQSVEEHNFKNGE